MKQLFTTAVLLFSATAFAQVGINNTSPKATLDISPKTTDGSKPEGLLIPQLDGNTLKATAYGTSQKGVIVYAKSAASPTDAKTINVTAEGYYYYDGSVWQKIVTGSSLNTALTSGNIYVGNASNVATSVAPTGDVTISNTGVTSIGSGKVTSSQIADGTVTNADLNTGVGGIYKGNGSLSGNTTVTQGSNTLTFSPTVANGFSIDSSTLSVDGANHRVGIGTVAPKSILHANTPTAGGTIDAGIFSINNCGGSCAQGTARNIVLNNLNSTNGLFASIDFVPSLDPTAASGASIQGIDRDATNNYAGLVFYTRNANNYASRMIVKSSGRVGVGTSAESPQATLDVKAISSGTSPEGIIAPRLSLTALQGYTYDTNQTGAIVYVNSVASATPAGQTANVTATGYYFFDGTNWQKVASGNTLGTSLASGNIYVGNASGTAAAVTPTGDVTISNTGVTSIGSGKVTSTQIADGTVANADLNTGVGGIYKGNGSLSGNTTVTQGTNTLAFSSSATNGFSVAGSTLSVDGANNRVGIGTSSPSTKLEINSATTGAIKIVDGTQGVSKVLTSDANGVATWSFSGVRTVRVAATGARNTSGTYSLTSGGVIVYTIENLDVDNAYNSSTGVFTAPRDGYYTFEVATYLSSSNTVATNAYVDLMWSANTLGSYELGRVWEGYSDSYGNWFLKQGTNTMFLTAGQTIKVVFFAGGTSPVISTYVSSYPNTLGLNRLVITY